MGKLRTFTKQIGFFIPCLVLIAAFLLSACSGSSGRPPQAATVATVSPAALALEVTATPTMPPPASPTPDLWPSFEPSKQAAPTAVPAAAARLSVPDELQIWLLMGTGLELPYRGRTDAFHLLIFNQRLARAALVSIPGSLYLYLPGKTMQRLSTAYALGGFDLVNDALAYNFGLRAQRFVLAHPEEFGWLIDDLGGLEVSVLYPIRDACGGIPAGLHSFDSEKTLCYVSFVSHDDEVDRVRRQQQVLQLLFNKLVQNGRIAMLPVLYASYQAHLETDLGMADALASIPLALKLGDPQRVAYFVLGWDHLEQWELPDDSQTKVLLPRTEVIQGTLRDAIAAVMQSLPLSEAVLTLEAQATQAAFATQTAIALMPPTLQATATMRVQATPSPVWQTPIFMTPRPTQGPAPVLTLPPQPTFGPYPAVTVPVMTSMPYP